MIQFDDPACLLFTSVSPQTGFISKILEDFEIKMRFGSEHWSGVLQCDCSNLRGTQKKIIQSQRFSKARLSSFFFKRNNNIHKFEGSFVGGEVCSNGFKVFNGWIVEP